MGFRFDEKALQAHQARMAKYKAEGKVTTHRLGGDEEARPENKKGGRVSKYGSIKAEADGIKFASKAERGRYMDLRLMERAGEIEELRMQVRFPLIVNDLLICDYLADFQYQAAGGLIVEDVKGYKTREYMMKKKLMLAIHGVEIKET
jgi:hypothetical protein